MSGKDDYRPLGTSPAVQRLKQLCQVFASTRSPILLVGPTGSEFDQTAAFVHQLSNLRATPLLTLHGGNLSERELNGSQLQKGMLFIHDIDRLQLAVQWQLSELIARNDPTPPQQSDHLLAPRVVCSTSADLGSLVQQGSFCQQLFWQLSPFVVPLVPLCQRLEDLPALAVDMIVRLGQGLSFEPTNTNASTQITQITQQVTREVAENLISPHIEALTSYHWPGNYRELESVLKRAFVLGQGHRLEIELPPTLNILVDRKGDHSSNHPQATSQYTMQSELPREIQEKSHGGHPSDPSGYSTRPDAAMNKTTAKPELLDLVQEVVTLGIKEADKAHREPYSFVVDRVEKALIIAILNECDHVQTKTATRLGINRNTLHKKMKDYGLE